MANKVLDIESVKAFWKWFLENYQSFGENFENALLINELDSQVTSLGDFTWEIGPGSARENQLVISPNGNAYLLNKTKAIVGLAPDITTWEFFYAKPSKNWNFIFGFLTEAGVEILIDASKWKYVLLKYPDGTFEIVLNIPEFKMLTYGDQMLATEIFLDSTIGEEERIKRISNVVIVNEFSQQLIGKENLAVDLRSHLLSLSF